MFHEIKVLTPTKVFKTKLKEKFEVIDSFNKSNVIKNSSLS